MRNLLLFLLPFCISLYGCSHRQPKSPPDPSAHIAKKIVSMADSYVKSSKSDYFDFADLSSKTDTLPYEYHEVDFRKPLYVKTAQLYRSGDSLKVYELGINPSVRYYDYRQDADPDSAQYHDGVEVAGMYFNIDSMEAAISKHRPAGKNYSADVSVNGCYVFHMKQTYIAFEYRDMRGSSSCPTTKILFFELRNDKVSHVSLLLQACQGSIRCINDFNKDGNIDYASVGLGHGLKPEVQVWTLTGTEFVRIPDHYVPMVEGNGNWYRKAKDFSHWF